MEIVYATIVGGIFGILSLLLLDRSKDKKYNYELKRFKYSKRAQKELKSMELIPRHVPDLKENALKTLINKGAEYLSGDNIEESEDLDPLEVIINYARSNPEIVKKFLGGGSNDTSSEVSALR
jgi:type IV secretory pathway VirB4 component